MYIGVSNVSDIAGAVLRILVRLRLIRCVEISTMFHSYMHLQLKLNTVCSSLREPFFFWILKLRLHCRVIKRASESCYWNRTLKFPVDDTVYHHQTEFQGDVLRIQSAS
jgi:hypothetical protein